MKFRIKHVLIATAAVAVFAYGLSFPDYYAVRWFRFGAWAAAVLLMVRAVSRPAERQAIACGLVAAASYLAIVAFHEQPFRLPTTALLKMVRPEFKTVQVRRAGGTMSRVQHNANAEEFRTIGEYGFATIFGLIAAGLAVYWSDESTNPQEPKP